MYLSTVGTASRRGFATQERPVGAVNLDEPLATACHAHAWISESLYEASLPSTDALK